MILLAKAILLEGKFKSWDKTTDQFYFKGWATFPTEPLWDCNQWFAQVYEDDPAADVDRRLLGLLGFTVYPLGSVVTIDPRPKA